ncbi:hypothetical protein [Streptomyces sp. NPDC001089]
MSMTRKHYRSFAEILAQARKYYPEAEDALVSVTRSIADLCATDNHHFRRQQFYDAAEPEKTA